MGGTIAMTLRHEDGTVLPMYRWTNILQDWLTNLALLEGDPAHMAGCMKNWEDMRKDWEANGPDGPFEHNMTSCYFPSPEGVHPGGYGLVVLDLKTKQILHCQGYTSIGKMSAVSVQLDLHAGEPDAQGRVRVGMGEDAVRFMKLWEAGRIKTFERFVPDVGWVPEDLTGTTFNDIIQRLLVYDRANREREMRGYFIVDMDPFTTRRFDESQDGFQALRDALVEMGFELNEDGWDRYLSDRYEDG